MYGLVLRIPVLFLRENAQDALGIALQVSHKIPLLERIQHYFTQKSDFSRYTNLAGFEKIDSIQSLFNPNGKLMQPPIVGIDLRWFDASYGTGMKFGNHGLDFTNTSIPIDETSEQSHIEMMQLALGANLYRAACCLKADRVGMWTPLVDMKGEAVEPLFHVLTAWKGRGLLHDRRVNTEMRFGEGQCTFQFIDGFDQRVIALGGGGIESESFIIGYSTLCQLLGRSSTRELMAQLGVAKVQSANALPVPRHICAILHACFTSPFNGNLHKLHAQAKLLEFICALAGYFSLNLPRQSKQCQPDLLQHVHKELTRLEGAPLCVDELSRRYGLSARALKQAFKEEYGQSIHAFVKNYRLDYAHASLQNTKRPLKLVAAQLGYSHVNHFINAFSKKFGYPPGSINQSERRKENHPNPTI